MSTPNKTAARKCPFCGGDQIATKELRTNKYVLYCITCEAAGPPRTTFKFARESWNGKIDKVIW